MRRATCNQQLGDYAHVDVFAESDQQAEGAQPAADLLGILPRPLQVKTKARRARTAAAVRVCHRQPLVLCGLCLCGLGTTYCRVVRTLLTERSVGSPQCCAEFTEA